LKKNNKNIFSPIYILLDEMQSSVNKTAHCYLHVHTCTRTLVSMW